MGHGRREQGDEENPQSEDDEKTAERKRLNEQEGIELKKIEDRPRNVGYPQVILGSQKPFLKTSHLKYALLTFNFILALLGLTILIMAIWVRVDPEFWEYQTNLDIGNFYTVCHMLIVAGVIILLVAFLGCFGVFVESQWMLTAYFVIYTLIFIIQLAAVIMIWSAPHSASIQGVLQRQIKKQVDKRGEDESSRRFVDFLQSRLECCGSVNSKDYADTVPKSCESRTTGYVHSTGCTASLMSYLKQKAGIIGGIAVPVLLFQLFALIVCFCLIYNIKRESRYSI